MRAAAPSEVSEGLPAISLAMLFCAQRLGINPPDMMEIGPAALLVSWPKSELQKQLLHAALCSAFGNRKLHRFDGAAVVGVAVIPGAAGAGNPICARAVPAPAIKVIMLASRNLFIMLRSPR